MRHKLKYVQISQIIFDVQGQRECNASQNQTGQSDECFHFITANQINEEWANKEELSICG